MLTLENRMDTMEENFDRLESMFGHFIVQTSMVVRRMEKAIVEDRKLADEERKQAAEERKAEQKAWNKRWGDLARKWGTLAEDIVAPNIPRIAKEHFGCEEIEDFAVRRWMRSKKDHTKRREFDVIAVCKDKVILNETKDKPKIEYINDFIDVLPEITDYFPDFKGKCIIPVFASLYIGEDVVNYLTKKKIYAMAMGGDTMHLLNFQAVEGRLRGSMEQMPPT